MMTSRKIEKKFCDAAFVAPTQNNASRLLISVERKSEGGYTLVALLALMTIFAILAMAAAPSIQQQNMRDKETEAIARGEEVSEAIRLYVFYHAGVLPTSMDQLLEGVSRGGTKKIQILRPEAAIDPLTGEEWRRIGKTDSAILNFERDVINYAGTRPSFSAIPAFQVPQLARVLNIGSKDETPSTSADDGTSNTTGPFIGIASRDKRPSVTTYYGIDHHDGWVFTPAINPRCDQSRASCE